MGRKTGWRVHGALVVAVVLLASVAAVSAPGKKLAKKPNKAPAMPGGTASLHLTVYETTLPAGRVAEVDAGALQAKADTPADLKAVLDKLGETRILYHAYQLASLAGESRIRLGSRTPSVMNTRMVPSSSRTLRDPGGPSGSRPPSGSRSSGSVRTTGSPRSAVASRPPSYARINAVQYQDIGMMLELAVEPKGGAPKGALHTQMELELSVLAEGGVEIAKGVKATEVRTIQVNQAGEMRLGRPIVTVHVDGSARGKDAPATAYVCRVLLSEAP